MRTGNSREAAAFLLSLNADPEARTAYKMTPLHVAAFYGSTDVMKLLLEEVPDIQIDALDFGSCEWSERDWTLLATGGGVTIFQRGDPVSYITIARKGFGLRFVADTAWPYPHLLQSWTWYLNDSLMLYLGIAISLSKGPLDISHYP